MQKMARFKILARRLGGFNVDIFRMAQDDAYARELLMRAQEVDNETLILLALELSDALGLLEVSKSLSPCSSLLRQSRLWPLLRRQVQASIFLAHAAESWELGGWR